MRENHRKVPLALTKFSKIENFEIMIFIYININYPENLK